MNLYIKKLFYILDHNNKKKLILVQILLLIAASFEFLGILSIAPLIQLISDAEILDDKNQMITKIYHYIGIFEYSSFLKIISIFVLIIFFFNFLIATYTLYIIEKFSYDVGNFLKSRLFKVFSLQPWIVHSRKDTSSYQNKINIEVNRVSQGFILPLLYANSKLFTGLVIIIFLLIYKPIITISCVLIFFIFYFAVFKFAKNKIYRAGFFQTQTAEKMFKIIFETFGGMKETILHKKQKKFHDEFYKEASKYAKVTVMINFLKGSPKLFLEFFAFFIIILSILYLTTFGIENNLKKTLPILGVFIFAGYKLLPIFQAIYSGMIAARASLVPIDNIYSDLKNNKLDYQEITFDKGQKFKIKNKIQLENINFKYLDNSKPLIKNINLNIYPKTITSIVGRSGSGKSTLLDIILGLLKPQKGTVLIDGKPLDLILDIYQNNISYVGQNVFLHNTTILSNICFGINNDQINQEKLQNAIEASNLSNLINELPDGINSSVGEGGIKISGGQKQRIAIARALYLDRDIIILDEATSSLDGIAEAFIINKLKIFANSYDKTIIMVTHNLKLTRDSDNICLIEEGNLIESGKFDDLIQNETFRNLLNEKKN